MKVIQEIGPQKVAGICTDNAANMKKAWSIISDKHPHIQCYGCAAHTLNLIFTDTSKLKTADGLMKDCVLVAKTVKQSQKLSALLKEKNSTTLKLPVKTR